jgi:hypothetical protein
MRAAEISRESCRRTCERGVARVNDVVTLTGAGGAN